MDNLGPNIRYTSMRAYLVSMILDQCCTGLVSSMSCSAILVKLRCLIARDFMSLHSIVVSPEGTHTHVTEVEVIVLGS